MNLLLKQNTTNLVTFFINFLSILGNPTLVFLIILMSELLSIKSLVCHYVTLVAFLVAQHITCHAYFHFILLIVCKMFSTQIFFFIHYVLILSSFHAKYQSHHFTLSIMMLSLLVFHIYDFRMMIYMIVLVKYQDCYRLIYQQKLAIFLDISQFTKNLLCFSFILLPSKEKNVTLLLIV